MNPLSGEVFTEFDGSWEDRDNFGNTQDLKIEEGVRIRQTGDIMDPRIVFFALEVEPTFSQERLDGPGLQEDQDEFFLSYDGRVNVMQDPEFPVGFDASVTRNTGDIDGSLGSRTEFDFLQWNAALNWKQRYFPSTLTYSERFQDQTFESGFTSVTSERDDVLRRLSYRGHSSKLNILLEREWFDDMVNERDADSTTNRASASHRLLWGKGSQLTSRLDYVDRNGTAASERLVIDETVEIQHTKDLSSSASYNFQHLEQQTDTYLHRGDFSLRHQLYDNLTTTLATFGQFEDGEAFRESRFGGTLDFDYRKRIAWDGTLTLGAGGGYRVIDLDSEDGLLGIVDERHVVDFAGGSFLLNQRFVDQATIVVFDAGRTVPFTLGSDYLVRSVSNNRTEISAVPGGGINPGDTVSVDYQFESLPSAKYYGLPYRGRVGLDFGWIAIFHETTGEEQALISGEDESVLSENRDSSTRLELRWDRDRTRATFSVEKGYRKLEDFNSETLSFRQSLFHTFSPVLTLGMDTGQILSVSDDRDTDIYTSDLSLTWLPGLNFTIRPHASAWYRTEELPDEDREEYFITGGVDFRWFWRQVEVDLRYRHELRGGDINDAQEDRVTMRVSRSF